MNILDYKPKIETEGGYRPEKLHGVIELVNVSFAYPARRDRKVLSNLSFKAEQGSMVGLVGPSGSGKSTIFQLLMRFYDPTEGQVLLDGVDLKEYDVVWLRKRIGEVKQSTKLFEMSVEDNIRFGCADATRAEVVQVPPGPSAQGGGGGLAQGLGGWLCEPVAAPIGLSPLNLLL